MEQEIDLREYIDILIKHWKLIVAVTIIAAAIAFVLSSLATKVYQANADIILLPSETTLNLEPKIETQIQDPGRAKGYQETWLNLVGSSAVTTKVLEQAGPLLPPELQDITRLSKKASSSNAGDIISIAVTDPDPELAALLANTWASVYVDYANALYSDSDGQILSRFQAETGNLAQTYQTAQTRWEAFLAENQIPALNRQLELKQQQSTTLKEALITSFNREIDTKREQSNKLNIENAEIQETTLNLYKLNQDILQKDINQSYNKLLQIDNWLADAQTLRNQVENQSTSPGANTANMLALVMLQSEALASSAATNVQLQIDPASFSDKTVTTDDVDTLIAVLEERRVGAEQEISDLSQQITDLQVDITLDDSVESLNQQIDQLDTEILLLPSAEETVQKLERFNQSIATLDQEIQTLDSQLENQQALKRELQDNRDLAWDNYKTMQRKLAELELGAQITDSQVKIAAPAIVPSVPIGSNRLRNTAVAGAIGLMLSVFFVFAWEYWRSTDDEMSQSNAESANQTTPVTTP